MARDNVAAQSEFMRTALQVSHQESCRRLLQKGDLPDLLQLNPDQIDHLIRTGQLRPIQICGETRFDSHEISTLIETYSQVQKRRRDFIQ